MADRFGVNYRGMVGTHFWKRPQLGRRMFFRHVGAAVGGYFLLPSRPMETIARAAGTPLGTAKNCIFVLLAGGPSHVDTFDLKEGPWLTPDVSDMLKPASYGDVRFPQGLMPKLAEHMESIALLRSVKSWAAVHELARTWIQIGRNPVNGLSKIAPHIGSVASLELSDPSNQTLPAFVSLNANNGPGQGYLPPEYSPFYISPAGGGLANSTHRDGQAAFDRRFSLLQELDSEDRNSDIPAYQNMAQFNLSARKLMYNSDVNDVFTFDQATRDQYGTTAFGNACIAARNLLRSKLGTRFIQITLGSWDHHANIYVPNMNLQAMTRQLDNGLGQLISDLKADGTFDQTLIIAMGEFGRTVSAPNSQGGRDHFLQQAVLTAGAKIRGGRAIGKTDAAGKLTVEPGWSQDREIRPEDIEATIYSALGIDWTTVRRDDPLGRGFEYVPSTETIKYAPVTELWG